MVLPRHDTANQFDPIPISKDVLFASHHLDVH